MDYPTQYGIGIDGFTVTPDDGSDAKRADDGTLRIRRLYAASRYAIQIPHPYVLNADYLALLAFYDANKNDVQFTDPRTGVQYTGMLTKPPAITAQRSALRCDVMMYFEGTVIV